MERKTGSISAQLVETPYIRKKLRALVFCSIGISPRYFAKMRFSRAIMYKCGAFID